MERTGSGNSASVTTSVILPLALAASNERPGFVIRDFCTDEARVLLAA